MALMPSRSNLSSSRRTGEQDSQTACESAEPSPFLAQSRHISIISLSGNESQPEWYIVIRKSHELTRPVLPSSQPHVGKIRYTPHHVKHHCAIGLVKRHGYEISVEILYLHSLHLIKGEFGQKNIVISVTNLKYKLG
uniref:Uncharacterized protein n=1 Tax=Vitis vinifera TaxID=29760 RepID=A5AXG8_VITVI|nr:hypothetical protein VITISV_026689 [Vitis vinifera]